jgi:nucleoside-diphosphate-sugar epimerase
MDSDLHVIFGTGPVGCWTARALLAMGRRVRAVNRSGLRSPLLAAEVELVRADVADAAAASEVAKGAVAVVQALNPPYHLWQELFPTLQANAMAAAMAAGARYVSIENLYMVDASGPIRETSPIAPVSRKGALRQRMAEVVQEALRRGHLRAAALRSSDYYGPGVRTSVFAERVFARLLAGRPAEIVGAADVPHSFAYSEDVGRSAALLATEERALGEVWIAPHAPAVSQGEMVRQAGRLLGRDVRFTVISPLMLRLVGLFIPAARASVEMLYQFTAPFVVDSQRMEQAFGLTPTPLATGLERTLAWYREAGDRG